MSQENSDKVIIDLAETNTKAYDDKHFIQKDAKETFTKLVEKFRVKCEDSEDGICHVHNTILINGKRGMGKSSFALHVAKHKFEKPDIHPLPIIDPTLVETREHIFLLIITQIKNEVEEYINNSNKTKENEYRDWKQSLKDLAGGLSMLDGIGKSHLDDSLWDSPELALEKGLSNSKHGHMLEKNFQKFVSNSLNALGNKKAFLIILDDIDTSLDKGGIILEVLRKYITTPKIITVLLGDIELYSTLVRQLQWKKIDPDKILKDYEFDKNKEKYLSQIEHLEEQYLVKILKPENRIHLKTIHQLMDKIEITPKHPKYKEKKEFTDSTPLAEYSSAMMEELFLSKRYTKLFEQTLYNQPTRSVVQLLKAYGEHGHELNSALVSKFQDIFYTTLYKQLSQFQLLEIESFNPMNLLGKYVIASPNVNRDSNLELLPEYSSSDENIAAIYLNLRFNSQIKQKDYLSYFIKVGYALEQYNANVSDAKDSKLFINHIGLDSTEPNARIARRLLTTFKIENNKYKTSYFEFGNMTFSQAQQKEFKDNQRLPLLLSKVYNPVGGKLGFLSFWNLLGVLADITQAENEKEALEILKSNRMIRDYYLYSKSESIFTTDADDDEENEYKEQNEITFELFDELAKWAMKIQGIEKLPLYVLAKIWVRVVYTFHEIDTRKENKKKTYLDLFLLYISGFLNAIFVQVELYNLNTRESENKLDIKNPSKDIKFFENKLFNYKILSKKDEENKQIFENKYYVLQEDGKYIPTSLKTDWGTKLYRKVNDEYISIDDKPETLFEFLYICPLLSQFKYNFSELENFEFKSKSLWGSVLQKERKQLIDSLKNEGFSVDEIYNELSQEYTNIVKDSIQKIYDIPDNK